MRGGDRRESRLLPDPPDQHPDDQPFDPGVYANLLAVAKRNPEFATLLEASLGEANLPMGNWARLVRPSFTKLPDLDLYREWQLREFTRTLYCDLYESYGDADFGELLRMADHQGGYFDTHLLMGLRLLEANGCRDGNEVERQVKEVGQRILEAQRQHPDSGDLFVERTAFLFWAGLGDRIEEHWIRTLLANQNADHGWGTSPGQESHPHPASLAILALTYYLDGRAQQEFFYPAEPSPVAARAR